MLDTLKKGVSNSSRDIVPTENSGSLRRAVIIFGTRKAPNLLLQKRERTRLAEAPSWGYTQPGHLFAISFEG